MEDEEFNSWWQKEDIKRHLRDSHKYLMLLMAKEREIFPGSVMDYYKDQGGFHNRTGITTFCNGSNVHKEELEKMKSLYEAEVHKYDEEYQMHDWHRP
jgi:hypothetical protein